MSLPNKPDASKLSKNVIGWETVDPESLFRDGDQLLLAMPVTDRLEFRRYEYHSLVVKCDEEYMGLETAEGQYTGLCLEDFDFFVRLD